MLENEIYDWLEEKKIHTPEHKVFGFNEKPEANFYPAALKIESPKVIHKSEFGGVAINLNGKEDLQVAKETILSNLRMNGIELDEKDKFLVSRMYSGIELFFGIVNDPVFERVIVFGAGGIFTELFKDVCFIDSEADDREIMNAIAQTKISSLFTKGFRGKKYNIDVIVDFIKKLQQLDVTEMDLNPVILHGDTLTVVDARLLEKPVIVTTKTIKYLPEIFAPATGPPAASNNCVRTVNGLSIRGSGGAVFTDTRRACSTGLVSASCEGGVDLQPIDRMTRPRSRKKWRMDTRG